MNMDTILELSEPFASVKISPMELTRNCLASHREAESRVECVHYGDGGGRTGAGAAGRKKKWRWADGGGPCTAFRSD